MPNIEETISKLTRQLYSTGRAFKYPEGGIIDRIHIALGVSLNQAYNDAINILNVILPDNDKFLVDDASDWERRLGIVDGTGKDLEDRKAAIFQKLAAGGLARSRSHHLYLQLQLQKAGFNVFVHENLFPVYPDGFESKGAFEVAEAANPGSGASLFSSVHHGGGLQHGQSQHGLVYNNIVVNSVDPAVDQLFNIGSGFEATFFIGGEVIGESADVPAVREVEFRQLILKVKPTHNVGFLFINYI